MATLLEIAIAHQDVALRNRVAAACWKLAHYILDEAVNVENHANRVLWSKEVIEEDANGPMVRKLTALCLGNPTINGSLPNAVDTDIEYVVNVKCNIVADGIYGA